MVKDTHERKEKETRRGLTRDGVAGSIGSDQLRVHANVEVLLHRHLDVAVGDGILDPLLEVRAQYCEGHVDDPLLGQLGDFLGDGVVDEAGLFVLEPASDLLDRQVLVLGHEEMTDPVALDNCEKRVSMKRDYLHFFWPEMMSLRK